MRWQGGQGGGNVEDRRGMGAVGVGGMGVGGVVLALVGYFFFGIDPSTTMGVVHVVLGEHAPVLGIEELPRLAGVVCYWVYTSPDIRLDASTGDPTPASLTSGRDASSASIRPVAISLTSQSRQVRKFRIAGSRGHALVTLRH